MELPNHRFLSVKSVWQLIIEKAKGFAKKGRENAMFGKQFVTKFTDLGFR